MRFTDLFIKRPGLSIVVSLIVLLAGVSAFFSLPLRESVGLANTRERLANEYAGRATLTLDTAPGAGFRVDLTLPVDPA